MCDISHLHDFAFGKGREKIRVPSFVGNLVSAPPPSQMDELFIVVDIIRVRCPPASQRLQPMSNQVVELSLLASIPNVIPLTKLDESEYIYIYYMRVRVKIEGPTKPSFSLL